MSIAGKILKQTGSMTLRSMLKAALVLCCALLIFHPEVLRAQVISNNGGVISVPSGSLLEAATIENNSGTVDNDGTINVNTITNAGTVQGDGTYNITQTFTNTGTFTPGTSTVDFNGSGAQTIPAANFYHLLLSNSGTKTFTTGTTGVAGNFTVSGTAAADAVTNNTTVLFNGTSAQQINGSVATTFFNLTLNNAAGVTNTTTTTTVNNTLTLTNGTYTLTSGLTIAAAATIVRGDGSLSAVPTFGATLNLQYTNAGAVSTGPELPAAATVLNDLTINNSAAVTLSASPQVNGTLTLTAGTLDASTFNITMAGTSWTNNGGTFNGGSGNVTFTGAAGSVGGTSSTTFNDMIIANNTAWTIDGPVDGTTLSLATGVNNTTLTINGTNALAISGAVTINASTANGFNKTIAIGAGSLSTASVTMGATTANTRDGIISLSTGTLTITGDLTMASAFARHHIDISGAATINIGGTVDNGAGAVGGGFTTPPATSTINLNGSSAQTVFLFGGGTALGIVKINNATGVTATAAMTVTDLIIGDVTANSIASLAATTVNGGLTITSGTLNANNTLSVAAGTTNISGTLNIANAAGAKTFVDVNLNANGTLNFDAVETATIGGSLAMGNNSVISGSVTGIITVAGNLNITGTGVNIGTATMTVTGTTNVTGSVDFNSATGVKTLIGLVSISGGASWASSGNGSFVFRNGIDHDGASFSSGGGVYTFNTNPQNIDGTSQLTFANLTVTGITATYINTHAAGFTVTTALAGTGGLTMPINGILTLQGVATITTLTVTAVPNTVYYTSTTVAQTLKATTYHHLVVDKSTQVGTIAGNTTVNGDLTITNGTLTNTGGTFTVSGTTTVDGTLALANTTVMNGGVNVNGALNITTATGAKTFAQLVTINPGGAWDNSANEAITFQNGLVHNGATFNSGTGVYTFNTNAQSLAGSSQLTFGSITVTGVTVSNDNTNVNGLTISTALTGTGGLTNPANQTLILGGTSTITTLTATAVPNTVYYTSTTAAQTVKATTYHHLIIDKTAQVATVAATSTVNGDITVTSGTLTVSGGTFTATGTTTIDGTMTMGAAVAILMNGPTVINGTLSITSATGTKNFAGVTDNGTLNFTAAETATFNNNLVIGNNGIITGTVTGIINVAGNLNITGTGVTIGRSTMTIGGTTNITGDVDFNSVTGIKTFVGQIALSGSGGWSNSANSPFILQGGIQHDGASFASGTGIYTFNTNAQDIGGSSVVTIDNVTVTGITLSNTNTNISGVTVSTALSGTGGFTNNANRLLNIVGTAAITTLTATANPNTVNYNGGTQTVKGTTYHHLQIINAGVKTAGASLTVNGDLSLSATATLNDGGFQITGNASGALTLAAGTTLALGSVGTATLFPTNFINANILLDAASIVVYNSNQAQTISLTPTYGNLTLSSTAIVTKTISGGTVNVAGNITVDANNTLNVTGTGIVNVTGDLDNNGGLANNGTINIGP